MPTEVIRKQLFSRRNYETAITVTVETKEEWETEPPPKKKANESAHLTAQDLQEDSADSGVLAHCSVVHHISKNVTFKEEKHQRWKKIH